LKLRNEPDHAGGGEYLQPYQSVRIAHQRLLCGWDVA
jgi:hypothetical protein